MSATIPSPTLAGVTEAQVLEALDVVSRVYERAGVSARIEARPYRDPDAPGSEVIEIAFWIDVDTPRATFRDLIRSVPAALRARGLYDPEIPLTTHPFVTW